MGGEYSEVAETSCGASVFAAGNTIYELSGYDLESRTLEVWDLSPDDCGIEGVPSTADCYRYALTVGAHQTLPSANKPAWSLHTKSPL